MIIITPIVIDGEKMALKQSGNEEFLTDVFSQL